MITLKLGCAFLLMCRAHLIPKSNSHIHTFRKPHHYKIEQFGLPSDENLVYFKRYISSVNYDKKIPNWVLQYNCKEELLDRVISKRPGFTNIIDEEFTPLKNSYDEYSRGHLVPAGDYRGGCKEDTFILETNIVPQEISNNQGIWNFLEMRVRNNLINEFEEVWVLSGPLFIPYKYSGKKFIKYQIVGNSEIAVPNSLFKSIIYKKNSELYIDSYIIPNKKIESKSLSKFKVSIDEIEKVFKFPIFPVLNRNSAKIL